MEKITLLYIDDEPDSLTTVKIGLEDRGYEVLIADNGADALELLKTHTPDVIITDLRMAPMNGFELFQEVKKMSRFADTPFFFLTAVDDYLAQKYGHTLGVDAYLTKPIELEYFDSFIKKRLSKT